MNIDDEIREYLAQPENLATALEVAHHVAKLRRQFHARFWPIYENALRARLENSSHHEMWGIAKSERSHQNAWANRRLIPLLSLRYPEHAFLEATFEQGAPGSGFPLYYGIKWTRQTTYPVDREEYKTLCMELIRRGHEMRESPWWIITESTGYAAGRDRFVLRWAQQREMFVGELVELHWKLFIDTVDYLSAFNEAVSHVDKIVPDISDK